MGKITYCDNGNCLNRDDNNRIGFYDISLDEIRRFEVYDLQYDYYESGADICEECLVQLVKDSPNEDITVEIEQIVVDINT